MRWIRPKHPKNLTKNILNPYSYFFNKQKEDEASTSEDTPITDEGIQNVLDAAINKNLDDEGPSIKISYEKIPIKFFKKIVDQRYLDWINDSQVRDKYILEKSIKNEKAIPVLLFEDYNTTGILGDWDQHEAELTNGERNDYNIFYWYIGSPIDKGKEKGGSVGVGRLTFAFSSLINTFFTFSVRKDKSKFFIGMSSLGKSKKIPDYDQIARYGVEDKADDGSEIVKPITNEKDLKEIHKAFKLKREFDQSGTSMMMPFPVPTLTRNNMVLNTIDRYRYAFFHNKMKSMEILNLGISKDQMLDTLMQIKPNQHKRYREYFMFLDECEDIKKNNHFKEVKIETNSNPSKIKKEHFQEDQIDEIAKEYHSGKIVSLKIPLDLVKIEDNEEKREIEEKPISTHFKIFLKKTEFGLGMDDVMRGSMPVCDLRSLEYLDSFGLVLIDEPEAYEFYRKAESPNHRIFEKTEELVNSYRKHQNQILILKSSLSSLKNIIEDRESEVTDTATQGFFSWSGGEDDGKSTNKKGIDTKKEVSEWIFENPKGYEIDKLEDKSKKMHGLKIRSTDFKKECSERIKKIEAILINDKYRKTKIIEDRLKKQVDTLKNWSQGKNLDDLFPANIYISCAQDIEGQSYNKIFQHHDKNLDFNFSNKISNNIIEEREGDITDVILEVNEINLSINGPNFKYTFLFDAATNKLTGEAYDLVYESDLQRLKYKKKKN